MLVNRLSLYALIAGSLILNQAHADQCEVISKKIANKALTYLKIGTVVYSYCEPCGDSNFFLHADALKIKSMKVVPWYMFKHDENIPPSNWQIYLNGKSIDLAYTYVKINNTYFGNLSKLTGCKSSDVTAFFPIKKQYSHCTNTND